MTREEYIDIRKKNHILPEMLYEYYLFMYPEEKDRKFKTIEEFTNIVGQLHQILPVNIGAIYDFFDNKFNITILFKNNEPIEIY